MIGSLRGTLCEFEPSESAAVELVVDVGGVGYEVLVGSRHAASLPTIGAEITLFVHTHMRESAITLYGFATALERRVFQILLSAHGVGPALALAIVSVYPPATLAEIVAASDIAALSAVPGVGSKTAQRLVVDLGERLSALSSSPIPTAGTLDATTRQAVREALSGLGYGPDEVREALSGLGELAAEGDTATLLRAALQVLAPRR